MIFSNVTRCPFLPGMVVDLRALLRELCMVVDLTPLPRGMLASSDRAAVLRPALEGGAFPDRTCTGQTGDWAS